MTGTSNPTNLSNNNTSNNTSSSHTPDMMPLLGHKSAPEKFTGRYDYVKRFLRHYNQLCSAYNVTDSKDKCERLLDYCSTKVVKFIESLDNFRNNKWNELQEDLLKSYDAALKDT